jgi:hypothetical protein
MRNKKVNNLEITWTTSKLKRSFETLFEILELDEINQKEMKYFKKNSIILKWNEKQ